MKEKNPMEQPAACSLRRDDLENRYEAWRELLERRLLRRQRTDDGCVLTLAAAPGVGPAARELAGLEAECCPWMDVRVTEEDTVVTIRLTSSRPGGPEAIRELFQAG